MGETTKIAWTDHTFNPWWGCQRVSPGCENCYAEAFDARVCPDDGRTQMRRERTGNRAAVATHWGRTAERRFFGDKHWADPLKWNAAAKDEGVRHRVFCASMADVFEDRRDLDSDRGKLFALIEKTPWLDWQLLTKRPENWKLAPDSWRNKWPSNVWAGVTVESQEYADRRIPWLIELPAAIRFLSCEPLLEPIDLTRIDMLRGMLTEKRSDSMRPKSHHLNALTGHIAGPDDMLESKIDWVIVGGESGHGARPFDIAWARRIVADCKGAGVACFVKQLGAVPIDGAAGCSVPFRAKKADDPSEWPSDLRVQEFPSS